MISHIWFILILLISQLQEYKMDDHAVHDLFHLEFLDKKIAQSQLINDETDFFFEKIGLLDLSIQLKSSEENVIRDSLVNTYKKQIQTEVLTFTDADKLRIGSSFEIIRSQLKKINKQSFIDTIKLIKIKGLHYGPSVFYTREKAIVIPENILIDFNSDNFISVMIHEIAHIINRYNPSIKKELYQHIGFHSMGHKSLVYPKALKQRVLLNPDGIDDRYFINLEFNGEQLKAIPLIISNLQQVDPQKTDFFSYLKFDLYPLREKNNSYEIICSEDGSSSIKSEFMDSFFSQIKDNTQYIIHPDEIIADNIMHLILGQMNNNLDKYSNEGQLLLKKVAKTLSEF